MKAWNKALALLLALVMAFSFAVTALAADEADPEGEAASYEDWDTIKVFETTDIHGWFTDVSSYVEENFQYRLAYIANIVNEARKELGEDNVMLMDAGDIYQGTPHSNLLRGTAMIAAFDVMNYDVVALGNHEFDWDVAVYAADEDGTMPAYDIGGYSADSDVPVVTYNIYNDGTTDRASFLQDYVVLEKAGYKVVVIGYACDYAADIMTSKISPYDIDGDLAKLAAHAAEVKAAEEADIVMILAHADPASIADAMDSEVVDLVLGGHTHSRTNGVSEVTGIPYIQGYYQARGYSTAEVKVNPETKEVVVLDPHFEEINGSDNVENLKYQDGKNEKLDPDVVAISQAAWNAVKDDIMAPLVTVDKEILRSQTIIEGGNTIYDTTVAGNFLAGLMLEATADLNTIAAFVNPGGIRTEFTFAEGADSREITIADIYTIAPFENIICTYAVTGPELEAQLEAALQGEYDNSNYGSQMSGISVEYVRLEDGIEVISVVTDDGVEIDLEDETTTYNICTYIYCATLPGSPLENMTPLQDAADSPVDNQAYIAVLQAYRDAGEVNFPVDTTVRSIAVEAAANITTATVTGADGTIYYRLRDVAYGLKGTDYAFNVDWAADTGVVITMGGEYTVEALGEATGTAAAETITITVDGEAFEVAVENLGSTNYVSAKDLSTLLGVDLYEYVRGLLIVE